MQAVVGTQDGTTHQFELTDQQVQALTGKRVNEEVDGSLLGLSDYTLEITGGSDVDGFPMRASIEGTGRRKILLTNENGGNNLKDGERRRKSVRGNIVSDDIEQLNLKVVEAGSESVADLLADDEPSDEDE